MLRMIVRSDVALTEPIYVVLFDDGGDIAPHRATVTQAKYEAQLDGNEVTAPLGFDRRLTSILPALWYCLHLPRDRFDFEDLSANQMLKLQALGARVQRILPMPANWPPETIGVLKDPSPKLVIYDDTVVAAARRLAAATSEVIEICPVTSLSPESLRRHWNLLKETLGRPRPRYVFPTRIFTQNDRGTALLPTHFLARRMHDGKDDWTPRDFESQDEVLLFSYETQVTMSTLAQMETEGLSQDEANALLEERTQEQAVHARFPVVTGLPGVSGNLGKSGRRPGGSADDAQLERSVLQVCVTKRALAADGVGFISDPASNRAFGLLNTLETMWRVPAPRPGPIRRLLNQIGELGADLFTDAQMHVLSMASSVTAFSEFPIGLCRLPGDTAPLCCRAPVWYRPIVPLTRALQVEMYGQPTVYLQGKLKVLVAECISAEDIVGRLSRRGWAAGSEMLKAQAPNADLLVREIASAAHLRQILEEYQPDLLVLSAHGAYDGNRTGFMCGSELVLDEEQLGPMPNVVCMSSCQVSPRGRGGVNIVDLMLRQGALTVLGTLVPINAHHNAILMARFLIYVGEALAGQSRLRTLADVWHHTQSTNAVNDVLSATTSSARWARSGEPGNSVIEDFMLRRSVGRLQKRHIYQDTEMILGEMAAERGIAMKFESWMASQGFLPESLMYVLMGWPERIVFIDSRLEDATAAWERDAR